MVLAAALAGFPAGAGAVPPASGPASDPLVPVLSMGQPPRWKPYGGVFYARADRDGERLDGATAMLGTYKDITHPIAGILGLSGEVYGGTYGRGMEGGARLFATSRGLFVQVGADFDFRTAKTDAIISLMVPPGRGGLLNRGGDVRFDWILGRNASINAGVTLPLGQRWMGKTRPSMEGVKLPKAPRAASQAPGLTAEVTAALAQVEKAAEWIYQYTYVMWDDRGVQREDALLNTQRGIAALKDSIAACDALYPQGHTYAAVMAAYHDQLERAFTLALQDVGGDEAARGRALSAAAKRCLLDAMLIPYNRLLGQFKSRDSLRGFAVAGREQFATWLRDTERLGEPDRNRALAVWDAWVLGLERLRARLAGGLNDDTRLLWLPLQLSLRPEEHDTQSEIDGLIEKLLDLRFQTGNCTTLFAAQSFPSEVVRTIRAAREYHVLWLHDYDGVDAAGDVDVIAAGVTIEGYLTALTERVRDFDRTGTLPVFMILLDQHYYETNNGRVWMSLLEDPLAHELDLPRADTAMAARVAAAQEELRRAVAASGRLQQETARRGRKWLRQVVRVQVSITNPSDFSFRSDRVVRAVPFGPDNAMRDHRKIAFYDVTELDPGRGEALFAGTGIGEQYTTATWEDRALRAAGPTLVSLKSACRDKLLRNGFEPQAIPAPLQAVPLPADYDAQVQRLVEQGWRTSSLQVHNEVGFAPKEATQLCALLYTLMPAGGVIYAPDSIWASLVWAGMLAGASLRGCSVYVIAPSQANAPAGGAPLFSRMYELLVRLVEIGRLMAPEIAAAGGELHVGLYSRQGGVDDVPAKLRETAANYRRAPFLRELWGWPEGLYGHLERAADALDSLGFRAQPLPADARERAPKMHRKTQLFATRAGLRRLGSHPSSEEILAASFRATVEVLRDPEYRVLEKQETLLEPLGYGNTGFVKLHHQTMRKQRNKGCHSPR